MGNGNEEKIEDLDLKASEKVRTSEVFGKVQDKMKGTGGTLHLTKESECDIIPLVAWELSKKTGKPVVIVVRAT